MKKPLLLSILSLIFVIAILNSNAQSPNWQWAKNAGGASLDYAYSVATDVNGNTYVAGGFQSSSITFGTATLANAGGGSVSDMFIVKYDATGNVLWAKSAGGTSADDAYSIITDASGNVYVVGYFQSSSITFGSTTLTNAGAYDMFIVKYDASGNVLWAKSAGGTNHDAANSVITDASGNVYVAGYFQSSSITFGSATLTNVGN